jgi:hypothetical protein
MRLKFLPAIVCAVILSSCAHRKEIPATPSAAGLSKTATPTERVKNFFPPGVDFRNATPLQISDAVLAAVESDPDGAAGIAAATMDAAIRTGRFPIPEGGDSKQAVDPEPKRTLFDVLFPKKRSAQ